MKKIITIAAIIIILGLTGYIFVSRKSAPREVDELIPQKVEESMPQKQTEEQTEASSESLPAASFDTNDNLDQALQDLDQLQVLDQ